MNPKHTFLALNTQRYLVYTEQNKTENLHI